MESTTLDSDIKVFFITAKSFPGGIMEAHEKLQRLVPFSKGRKYFGISRPEQNQGIDYRAAAEELTEGEAGKLNCETLILKKGRYISLTIKDYTKDKQSIDQAFKKLLSYPNIDPQGYCVEWYLPSGKTALETKDVKCMVRLNDN